MRDLIFVFFLFFPFFAFAQEESEELPPYNSCIYTRVGDSFWYEALACGSTTIQKRGYFMYCLSHESAVLVVENFHSWLSSYLAGEFPNLPVYQVSESDFVPRVIYDEYQMSQGESSYIRSMVSFTYDSQEYQWEVPSDPVMVLSLYCDYMNAINSDVVGYQFVVYFTPENNSPYSDEVNASSSLAGATLATDSASDSGESVTLPNGITFTQTTAAAVDADEGDYSGMSTVNSTASASSDGTTVNITNNTEVNTNLELGDAPEDDSYEGEDPEEKEVKSSDDLLDESEPRYTYINSSSTEYGIDYNKLWDDCKEKLDEIFGTENVTYFFEKGVQSGGYLQPWNISFIDPWIHNSWGFTVDFTAIQSSSILVTLRSIFSFGIYLETLFMCIRLFA